MFSPPGLPAVPAGSGPVVPQFQGTAHQMNSGSTASHSTVDDGYNIYMQQNNMHVEQTLQQSVQLGVDPAEVAHLAASAAAALGAAQAENNDLRQSATVAVNQLTEQQRALREEAQAALSRAAASQESLRQEAAAALQQQQHQANAALQQQQHNFQ